MGHASRIPLFDGENIKKPLFRPSASRIRSFNPLISLGQADACGGFELWQGTRQIPARLAHHQKANFADLVQDHQRIVIEVAERIAQSHWTMARSRRLIETLRRSDPAGKYN